MIRSLHNVGPQRKPFAHLGMDLKIARPLGCLRPLRAAESERFLVMDFRNRPSIRCMA
jgi:hypothetical protein